MTHHEPMTVNNLKFGHSISFGEHKSDVVELEHVRSNKTLLNRYPSFPALVPDISQDSLHETMERRSAHDRLFTADASSFRRKVSGESTTQYFQQKQILGNFLDTLHPHKDSQDKYHKYTYSRITTPKPAEINIPLQDFLIPEDLSRPRSSGYSAGHIRSILGVDTFGPESSLKRSKQREDGIIPNSPNIDRYKESQRIRSRESGLGNTFSGPPSPASSTNMTRVSFAASAKSSRSNTSSAGAARARSPHSCAPGRGVGPDKAVAAGTLGFYGRALEQATIAAADPNKRSAQWYQAYVDRENDRKVQGISRLRCAEEKRLLEEQVAKEQHELRLFETRLDQSRYSVI